jgi:hypothetical protein
MTDKTELEKHVDKALADIIFNGCKISSAYLKTYFDTTILLAKLEQSQQHAKSMFKGIEVIGEYLTEPENIKPDDLVEEEWYVLKNEKYEIDYLFKFKSCYAVCENQFTINYFLMFNLYSKNKFNNDYIHYDSHTCIIVKNTQESVIKYFPNEINEQN